MTPQTWTLSIQSEKFDPRQWLKLTNQKAPSPSFDWPQLTKCNLWSQSEYLVIVFEISSLWGAHCSHLSWYQQVGVDNSWIRFLRYHTAWCTNYPKRWMMSYNNLNSIFICFLVSSQTKWFYHYALKTIQSHRKQL